MSVGQARQTLENLIEDRKVLSRQLAELRNQEQDEDDEPAAKVQSVCLSACLSGSRSWHSDMKDLHCISKLFHLFGLRIIKIQAVPPFPRSLEKMDVSAPRRTL